MISSKKQRRTWLVYLPVAIIIIYLFLQNIEFSSHFRSAYSLLLVGAILVGINPIRHNYTYYTFLGGLSLVTFIIFGLLPEIILTWISVIFLIFKSDIRLDQHHYYPLFLLSLTGVSLLSAGSYYIAQQWIENNPYYNYEIIPLATYMVVQLFSSQAFSTLSEKVYFKKEDAHLFDKHFKFFSQLTLVMIPFGFLMLYMYFQEGTIGLFWIVALYLILAIGAKYFYRVYNHRQILIDVNRYSRLLSRRTDARKVIQSFSKYMMQLFPANRISFAERNEEGDLVLKLFFEKGSQPREFIEKSVIDNSSPIVLAVRRKKMSVFLKAEDWQVTPVYEGDYQPQSVIVMPINILSEEKGVLLMSHLHQGVYDHFFVTLIEVFYMYLLIILGNAYNYEELTKSNFTDFLTGLPNYRGFSTNLDRLIEEESFDSLSLIILDLDHFKKVNDVHGHEAGNEVLKEIAEILNECTSDNKMVARYGGEEFVILLKDASRTEAMEMAETIRVMIENHSCKVSQSIETGDEVEVKVTASIGVATYPDNCDNPYDLVRLADDVMYTKSKQGGRNRVSEFTGYSEDGLE